MSWNTGEGFFDADVPHLNAIGMLSLRKNRTMRSGLNLCFTVAAAAAIALPASDALAKRLPPADVPPVVDGNVRYEAPHAAVENPCGQNGGCVVAYDNTTNTVLWWVKVYCTHYDPGLEEDVQDVFITSLAVKNGQVLVSNEKGQQFSIDPATQQVTGDPRGCDDGGRGGCAFPPTRVLPSAFWSMAVLSGLGLATILLSRRRR